MSTQPAIVSRAWHPYPITTPARGHRVWVTVDGCCERFVSVATLYGVGDGQWRESQDGRTIANVTHWMTMDYPSPAK